MKLLLLLLLLEDTATAQLRGLFPAMLNLASNAEISSNATCGDPEPEVYCKLVEHVPGRRIKNPHCPKCDANSVLSKERHPITNAIDGTNQWWQSPSIKNGRQFHWVTIMLDLKQIFQIAYIIIKAANSPRPGNWILERSLDGVTFDPWQYYAISDSECLTRYNITPRLGSPTYRNDTEVICTSYYSRLNPLEHGEIHTSLINGRPSSADPSSSLLNFTSARYIRLRLQRIRTLNADLMTLSARDPRDIDPIVTRRYYYSIKDISVGGMCICYGHAESCPLDPVTKRLQCVCEHNTCGESCNQCCPGYNQQLWQPGTISKGNTCEQCNCHNKAVNCYYNQTVSELSLSLNTRGIRQGGGVCTDCQQNTAGINCETCQDGYYRPTGVSPYTDSPCVQCNCDLRGSQTSVCVRDETQPGMSAGHCVCKEGFAGQQCNRCAFGYRDFPQCVRCECNLSGSTNTDPCGPCTCKVNVMGAHCDLCKPGFYNLQEENPLGCTNCFCFGVSDVCESSSWSMAQVLHTDPWLYSQSHHTPSDVDSNDLLIPRNNSCGHAHQQVLSWAAPSHFLGNKLGSYGGHLNYSLVYDIPLDNEDQSLPVCSVVIIQGNVQALRLSAPVLLFISPLVEHVVTVEIVPRQFVDDKTGDPVSHDDVMSVLADVTSLWVQVYLNTSATGPIWISSGSLDIADPALGSGVQAVAVETCECPWGYRGTSCETCREGFYRVGGVLFGGNCLQCECNDHSNECDTNGTCLDCTHNTTGPHCNQCLPGFYGDATEGTADDCQLCPCPLTEPSNSFSPTCVMVTPGQVSCDQCQDGYTGTNCERCASGYYGNPKIVGRTCARCKCNGNVDISEAGHCDTVTGECLRCLGNTAGRHCEVCRPGYYGDAVVAKDCRVCSCDVNGAISRECDVTTGQCPCRENVTGRTCDRCQVGFFGLQNGQGCQACGCNQSGSLSQSCDNEGQCQCVEGVAGNKCDHCSHGYYGFHGNGCTACSCNHTGGNCDPENGDCICPPHTEGDSCDRCEMGYWGHYPLTGCKPCSCSSTGSNTPQCDLINGICQCREGFSGRSCDQCAPGYHGYPACLACGCDIAGTKQSSCNTTMGVCDCQHNGDCVCKLGVSGHHCEECISGWFGLSAENPDGCSQCFCSGLSQDCEEQGGLTRVPINLGRSPILLPLVSQSNLQGIVSGVYQQDGDILLDTRHLNTTQLIGPLYWRLPQEFEGNLMMTYGGLLSYITTFYAEDGSGSANQEPQVMMSGGTLKKLVIYTDIVAPGNGVRTQHDIRMTEHKWKYFNSVSEKPVSRADFMSVLSNVQFVIIKASFGTRLQQSRISNITMETAVEFLVRSEATGNIARLIESCVCPPGYTGLSCQECAAGYFRQPWSELSSQSQKSMFVRPCVQCRCNNHSDSCDTDTGDCQNCKHNTSGRSCELCASGFYGNVNGSLNDCSLCACPRHDNSFSTTCVSDVSVGDFRCTACVTGYEGRYCEKCSAGYYGNPSLPGGVCSQCGCSVWGSLHPRCDPLTGQCDCKAGVKGRSCEQCEDQHVLQEAKCVSCDDECTGIILNDLHMLHNQFLSVNMSGVVMAPYHQLLALENWTQDLQVSSRNSSITLLLYKVENKLNYLTSDHDNLNQRVIHLSNNLQEVNMSINNSLLQSALVQLNINHLNNNVQRLLREAARLNQTTEEELDLTSQAHMMKEVETMLKVIRAVNQTATRNAANQEFSLAKSLARSLKVDLLSNRVVTNEFHALFTSLNVAMEMLQNANTQLSNATQQNIQTHTLLDATHKLLNQYQSVHQSLSVECRSVDGLIEKSQLLLDDIIGVAEELANTTSQVEVLGGQLDQWRPLLRKRIDGLVIGLKTKDSLDKVYRAESHADMQQRRAHSLHHSLVSMCNLRHNSSLLAQLDNNITETMHYAHQMASIANVSASLALNMTIQSEQLLSEQGGTKQTLSSAVVEESQQLYETAEDLKLNVSVVSIRLGLVRERVHNVTLLLHQPIRELQTLVNDSSPILQQAQHQTVVVQSSLQTTLQLLYTLRKQLQNSSFLVENTNHTVKETNQLLMHTYSAANEVQHNLETAEHRTQRLMERIKPLSMLGETLSRNLSEIRALIDQARRQAASIKVAVQADRDCVRSYKPEIQSSNFNTLSLILKTTSPDNLLFYLGSNTTVDYLAVEMHDGKVSMVWNVGSGSTRLDFPGLDITNNRWTRINATRFGDHASLLVHQLDSDLAPLPAATAVSPGTSRVLDVDRNTVIHIGGLAAFTQSPTVVKTSTFQGCVGEATLNERNIGLWNYVSREGRCGGCFSSPQVEGTSFHFDGSGFSLVQKSLRATSTSVVLLFKTLSPGGLLLYLASNNTRDFLSLELVEGRVRLTFDLGSGALILTTKRKYNTGVWFKITLQRNKRKGYLSIMAADQSAEKEVLEAESPGSASDLNRSDLDPIYIGGLPVSRPIRRQVASRSYVGCIRNVEIARSNFDLLRDAYGVRKGCVLEAVRSVSMMGGGFVQITPPSLGQEVELLFSFFSSVQSGVLLAVFSTAHSHRQQFLSAQLVSGALEVELGEVGRDSQMVTVMKSDGGAFSDGEKHSVIIIISRKQLSLQVDEDHQKSVTLLLGGFSRLSTASFFIGGLPTDEESHLPIRLQSLSRSFRGCIQNLAMGQVLVDLSLAVRYEGAAFDSCLLEERPGGVLLSDDQDVGPTPGPAHLSAAPLPQLTTMTHGMCASESVPSYLSSAAQFGSSKNSHMTFIINPDTVKKSVSVKLSVRSRAQDGMILLLSDSKQMDFIILRLSRGKLMMSADLGKGIASITSSVPINDGHWHTVSAEVNRRLMLVSVDSSSPDTVTMKGNQLDVNNRLYLGGLPHSFTTRRINVSSSFPGCVHSLSLNGATVDLSKPFLQQDATSCFSKDQTGSYFNGSGYAILMPDGYKVGSDMSVSIEFRTSQSDAVFLGISSAKVDAIGLELVRGQVVFNVNNGAGRVSVRSFGQSLCDGQWHRLLAIKTKHTLSLNIDGQSYSTPNPYPQSTSAETNDPVYVGGYPGGMRQNCLSIRSRFKGCLRKLQLIKSHLSKFLDLSSAHFLLGVIPDSCPVA